MATPGVALPSQNIAPADAKVMHDCVLTLPKVKACDAATTALDTAAKSDSALKAEAAAASSEHTTSMDGEFARLTHHPKVLAFYAKQGLSNKDAILIPLTLTSASLVVQYPSAAVGLADQTAPARIAFCKQNIEALKTMKFFVGL